VVEKFGCARHGNRQDEMNDFWLTMQSRPNTRSAEHGAGQGAGNGS
jgi:hypothetical protein